MNEITQLNEAVREAVEGGKGVKSLRSTFYRLWKIERCERWFYQLYETLDGRDSVIQQFAKLLLAWKVDDRASAECVWMNLDTIFHNFNAVGHPQIENPLEVFLTGMEADFRRLGHRFKQAKRILLLR